MAGVPDLLHAGRENDLSVFQENNIVQKLLDVRNQVCGEQNRRILAVILDNGL